MSGSAEALLKVAEAMRAVTDRARTPEEFRFEPGDMLCCSPDVADQLRRVAERGEVRLAGVELIVSSYLPAGSAFRISPKMTNLDFGSMLLSPACADRPPADPHAQNPAPSAGPGD